MKLICYKINKQLTDIQNLLAKIDEVGFTTPIELLSGASLGQHVRHIIEVFESLLLAYDFTEINYDLRKRDTLIETIPEIAHGKLELIKSLIVKKDKILYFVDGDDKEDKISTTYKRELHFNLDHTIHHMALIKVATKILKFNELEENFGLAYSTIKHKKSIQIELLHE